MSEGTRPAARIAELVADWRKQATDLDDATRGAWVEPSILRQCADELEAALSESAEALQAQIATLTAAIAGSADVSRWALKDFVALAEAHRSDSEMVDRAESAKEAAEARELLTAPRPIRAHVIGCPQTLRVPVDLCACGGRDFTPDALTAPRPDESHTPDGPIAHNVVPTYPAPPDEERER
jgi:hypothetical protein